MPGPCARSDPCPVVPCSGSPHPVPPQLLSVPSPSDPAFRAVPRAQFPSARWGFEILLQTGRRYQPGTCRGCLGAGRRQGWEALGGLWTQWGDEEAACRAPSCGAHTLTCSFFPSVHRQPGCAAAQQQGGDRDGHAADQGECHGGAPLRPFPGVIPNPPPFPT